MKTKLFENVGNNKFKLLTEAMDPDRAKLIREGLKKVFANTKTELSYDKIQNFGLGFIKDVNTARKCALQEARDIAPALGFSDHPETGTFVKEAEVAKENEASHEETPDSPEEKREVQIGKEIIKLLKADGQGRGVKGSVIVPSPEDCFQISKLAFELIKMHGAK